MYHTKQVLGFDEASTESTVVSAVQTLRQSFRVLLEAAGKDVTIVVEYPSESDQTESLSIDANSTILRHASDHFHVMLNGEWKESQSEKVTVYLESVDGKLYTLVLDYDHTWLTHNRYLFRYFTESIALKQIVEMAHQGHYESVTTLPAEQVLVVYHTADKFGFTTCMNSSLPILRDRFHSNSRLALRTIQLLHDHESIPFREELLDEAVACLSPIEESIWRPDSATTDSLAATTVEALDYIKYSPLNVCMYVCMYVCIYTISRYISLVIYLGISATFVTEFNFSGLQIPAIPRSHKSV